METGIGRSATRTTGASMLAMALIFLAGSRAPSTSAAPRADEVTIIATRKWAVSVPERWTPYVVTVRNEGARNIEGDVRLVPAPPDRPVGAAPFPRGTRIEAWGWALAAREVTSPSTGRKLPVTVDPGRFPSYSSRLAVAAGGEKVVTLVVLEAPFGYRAEFRERKGDLLGSSPAPAPRGEGPAVALLSRVADAHLPSRPLDIVVTQLKSPREVPNDALQLSGLQAVVIADFDTAALTTRQLEALRHYVGLGGNLVVAGGGGGERTVGPLPEVLIPMRPTGVVDASLGALAELVGQATDARSPVLTGDLRRGRVLLRSGEGGVLVADQQYGAGRVVQLAYDPWAEPLGSDRALSDLAWNQGLLRAASPWGTAIVPYSSALAPVDQLWSASLDPAQWPAWPAWAVGMLAAYSLLVGPLFVRLSLSRRIRRTAWVTCFMLAAAVVAATAFAGMSGPHGVEQTVVVDTLAPGGTVLTNSYRNATQLRPRQLQVDPAGAASTVFTEAGAVRPFLLDNLLIEPADRGQGGGTVAYSPTGARLEMPARRWEPRSVQSVTIDKREGWLEAHLQLVGTASPPTAGTRITGTVTNHGQATIRQLRAQLPEGAQTRLAEELPPGVTIEVDAPVLWATRHPAGTYELARRDDLLLFAAASRSFTRPGQVALVGLGRLSPGPAEGDGRDNVVAISVQPMTLEATEQPVAYSGQAEMIADVVLPSGARRRVYDFLLPGPGPLTLLHSAGPVPIEVYDWETREWRTLPQALTSGPGSDEKVSSALHDGEVNAGVVRARGASLERAILQPARFG